MKYAGGWLRIAGAALHFLVSSFCIFLLAYLVGHSILTGALKGGDSPLHVGYAIWLDQYFPRIPHWFPLQGGGESLLHGYPLLSHLIVVAIHRISSLSILQAFRLTTFLSFPLSAIGLYVFGWVVLRKKTIGLLAAIFYLLAPVTWTWMYDWGFFAQQVGMVFLAPSLVAFDLALQHDLDKRTGGARRLWLVVLVLLILVGSLGHMLIGAAAAVGMALYGSFRAITAPQGLRAATARSGLKLLVLTAACLLLLAAGYLVPFYLYGGVAGREGLNSPGPEQLHRLPFAEFFGLAPMDPAEVLTKMQFPLVVSVLALLGLLLAALQFRQATDLSRKSMALGLACAAGAIYVLSPALAGIVLRLSPLVFSFVTFRTLLLVVTLLLPVIAAHGAWGLGWAILSPAKALFARRDDHLGRAASSIHDALVPITALVVAWAALVPGARLNAREPWMLPYGASNRIDLRDVWQRRASDGCLVESQDPRRVALCGLEEARQRLNIEEFLLACDQLRDVGAAQPALCTAPSPTAEAVEEFIRACDEAGATAEASASPCGAIFPRLSRQLVLGNWPPFEIEDADAQISSVQALASLLPAGTAPRIDTSAYHGRLSQDLSVYSGASHIESYTQQLSLIHLTWGYQLGVFYSERAGTPEALNDLADWLGIQYVFLDPERDPMDRYLPTTWEQIYAGPAYGSRQAVLLRYLNALPMATASRRPSILVVGSVEKAVYPQVFQLANQGVISNREALLVEGQERIDRYSLDELQQFDVLLLHGYDYGRSQPAWDLLEEYVTQGGSLFIDTGWEFTVPEWEFEQAPAVLPVQSLSWENYGTGSSFSLGDHPIAAGLDASQISPLIWEQDPWSVSGADYADLRDWGRVVLSAGDHPVIVAGDHGQGRVVWSGMNLINHTIAYADPEERQLLGNALRWLAAADPVAEPSPPVVVRDDPDRVDFFINTAPGEVTWLYWREAFYPDWHAYLFDSLGEHEIPIYRAGPGFMAMPIRTDAADAFVSLSWEPSLAERAALGISALGLAILFALLLDGFLLWGNGFTWLRIAITMRMPKPLIAEGSNVEWAQKMQADLSARRKGSPVLLEPPPEFEPAPPPWVTLDSPMPPEVPPEIDEGVDMGKLNELARRLVHPESDWAQRILGRRARTPQPHSKGGQDVGETDG